MTTSDTAAIEQALQQGAFVRAERLARRALAAAPTNARVLALLGNIQGRQGRYAEAATSLRAATDLVPTDAAAYNSLGVVLHANDDAQSAEDAFRRAVEVNPRLIDAWWNLIALLMARQDDPGSLAAIDHVLKLEPDSLRARLLRSDVMRNTQSGSELAAEYRRIIADHPQSAWPWYGLANLKSIAIGTDDLAVMQKLWEREQIEGQERIALGFALGKALEDNAMYAAAFSAFVDANARVRQRHPWQASAFRAEIDAIVAACSALPAVSSDRGAGCIFLVSLPRAGSTLLEQMLASHAQIAGGGEVLHLENVLNEEGMRRSQALTQWAPVATAADWQRLGDEYLKRTHSLRDRGTHFTDKKLDNWKFTGALLAMLPQARVINCRRDSLETGLSCFKQLFPTGNELYSYDLADLGRYFSDYDRTCRRWAELFPDRFLDVRYEDLVAEPEKSLRRVLAFCGLEFDPACLKYHENRRSVVTVSAAQVREPLRHDTARADRYGAVLDPLRRALGVPAFAG